MSEHSRLLGAFVRRPGRTGAIVPSSRELARLMTREMGLDTADTVVELGAGTGVFTRIIGERLRRGAVALAFEIDPILASQLEGTVPGVRIVNDSAERISEHLRAAGRESADAILSGLPWAVFSHELQQTLLAAVLRSLRPGGRFATFAYVPAAWFPPGRRFRKMLESGFASVETSPIVWRNIPPAFVYRCRKA
jgi:phosphatidylethanolamine/phosphatidyl-N-methylethanolamine N-methyltransferase